MRIEVLLPSSVDAEEEEPINERALTSLTPKFYSKRFTGRGPTLAVYTDKGKLVNTYVVCVNGTSGLLKLEQRKQAYKAPMDQ